MAEVRRVNKKVGHLSKKVYEVIEWVRPYHHTDVAPKMASDRVPVEPEKPEVEMEVGTDIEVRDQSEVETEIEIGGQSNGLVIELETGGQQPEVEIEWVVTEMETGGHLDVENGKGGGDEAGDGWSTAGGGDGVGSD
ncbi:hypothetical protein Adt_30801 [Abeliophyllum distichum]|uniref:Uncharacterized protein n=1 Tax=Abeliophyllum distichum TaxID=126358 RepID=A0ABD1RC96_9LAMI